MTFYSPDIVILEIIFYRGTYDLEELTRKLLSELSLYFLILFLFILFYYFATHNELQAE